jgi:signal transduction histidine kinase/ActR/RegA family two-component response regulator
VKRSISLEALVSRETRDPLVHRVLVYAPIGRDGELSAQVLAGAGVWAEGFESLPALCAALRAGAATVLATEEALAGSAIDELAHLLACEPNWSDIPIILCTTGGDVLRANVLRSRVLEDLGNVMVIERPMQTRTLLAAVHAALRARRRQLDLRDIVTELERSAAERSELLEREKVARAEAEEANRAKDEFLAMISHELRTPLNAILGWSRMMTAGRLVEAQRERAAQTIERNAVAQAKLIDELLDVSRIISRKLRLSLRPLDLRPIVEATVDSLRPTAEAKGLLLDMSIVDDRVPVLGDSERLAQIVANLLGNAIKFTPAGGRIHIVLSVDGGAATLIVRDDGIGIREEFLELVFERFRQADGSRTRSHGGLGLGLAIVRHLVELHGGNVRAASDGLGKGAELTARIPLLAHAEQATMSGSDRPPGSTASALLGVRIVVVDDEQDARDLVSAVLEQAGAIVTSVGSAEEAMHAIREKPPSLIVSDIGMPGEDGYALIARVRALPAERGGRVPAVAVTAFTRSEDRARALRAGYTAHVGKPIDPSELVTLATNVTTRASSRSLD